MGRHPAGHRNGLGMVTDHARHKIDVGRGIGVAGTVGLSLGDPGEVASRSGGWPGGRLNASLGGGATAGGQGRRRGHQQRGHSGVWSRSQVVFLPGRAIRILAL